MNRPSSKRKELETLLQALEDGVIAPADRDVLAVALRNDPGARTAYCEHMLFAAALHSEAVDRQRLMEEDAWPVKWKTPARQVRFAVFAAAAVIALVAVVLSLFAVKPRPLASVSHSDGANWKFEAGGVAEKADFLKDSRIVVERGTVRLDFSSGTTVHIDAPSTLIVRNRLEVELEIGKAWIEVEKGDEGFSVLTKTLRAVDLGTVFGVEAKRMGSEVHVMKGRVRVESRLPKQENILLGAGQAAGSNVVGYLRKTAYDSKKFRKDLGVSKRIVQWSFDGDEPLKGKTNFGDAPFITIEFLKGKADPAFSIGAKGNALDLSKKGVYGASNYHCPLGGSPRTVAFWFRKTGGPLFDEREDAWRRHPPILTWGDDGGRFSRWEVNTTHKGSHIASSSGGTWNVSNIPSGSFIFDSKWHHVASVFTGETKDGNPEIIPLPRWTEAPHLPDHDTRENRHTALSGRLEAACDRILRIRRLRASHLPHADRRAGDRGLRATGGNDSQIGARRGFRIRRLRSCCDFTARVRFQSLQAH